MTRSAAAPVKSLAKAKSLVRAGTGDQMLLRRGDTFYEPIGTWTKGGRSADGAAHDFPKHGVLPI